MEDEDKTAEPGAYIFGGFANTKQLEPFSELAQSNPGKVYIRRDLIMPARKAVHVRNVGNNVFSNTRLHCLILVKVEMEEESEDDFSETCFLCRARVPVAQLRYTSH